jgi:NAD(P)H-flavin reductase
MASQIHNCTVTELKFITSTVFELHFDMEPRLTYLPGQFLSAVIPGAGPGGRDLRRAYSIAAPPEQQTTHLCIKKVEGGPGTTYLSSLKPGDTFKVHAPYGAFTYRPMTDRHAMFIATGTGISPFYAMTFSDLFRQSPPKNTTCLFGARDESELLYETTIGHHPGMNWISCVTRPKDGWKGFRGRVTDYLRQLSDYPWAETEFYICGNGAMIDEVKKILTEEKRVAKEHIHQEIYYKPKNGS